MEKKQSSIDWLEQQFNTIREQGNIEVENLIWQQAKAMHKEEMRDLYLNHVTKAERLKKIFEKQFEELYNETFGGNNE